MHDGETPLFQTPPIQSPENIAVWGDVLKALTIEDPNLKPDALRAAENLFARISKQGLLRRLQEDKVSFRRGLMDEFRWSPTTAVRSIYDAVVFSADAPNGEQELTLAAWDFFGRISVVAWPNSKNDGARTILLLDALATKVQEIHEGIFSFGWKQKVAVGFTE